MSKHPELHMSMLAPGVSFSCAYARLENGWALERAVSQPTHKRRPNRTLNERMARYNAKRIRVKQTLKPRVTMVRKRYTRQAYDTSPAHIRKIRAAYCDQFIKTGMFDESMAAQLRAYAHESRSIANHPERVSDEQAPHRHRGRPCRLGNERSGSAMQTTPARGVPIIGELLRPR